VNLTKQQIKDELEEKTKDLEAFFKAREIIRRRVFEVQDSGSSLTPLPNWSGTDAVLGTLDLTVHAIERTVEELKTMLENTEEPQPLFRLVKGGDDDQN
jgi:hypothetical protein